MSTPSITRLAGAAYALVIVLGVTCSSFIDGALVADDAHATLARVRAAASGLHLAFLGEMVMFALVVAISLSLGALLEAVDGFLARLAATLRCVEAVVGAALALLTVAWPLRLARQGGEASTIHALIGLRSAGLDVVLFFMGLGGALFFVLLWRSRLVPRALAGWGLLTYATMIALSSVGMTSPDAIPEATRMLFFAPGGVFELVFGLWLLARGLRTDGAPSAGSARRAGR
jgi:hypothetical protein